jgi:transcriptional regulator GlxA family with amidase domain
MNRRQVLGAALVGGLAVASGARAAALDASAAAAKPLPIPKSGEISVAFVISDRANLIDLAGPWETFQDMMLPNGDMPFHLYTVAETLAAIETVSGLRIEPTYSFDSLPGTPNVIVVGAQSSRSPRFMQLLREAQGQVDLTMSVCTGAFKLAQAGILDGKSATTHHDYYDQFAKQFPKVTLVRGERFVDNGSIITAGGLTSGISAALHVISRYYDADSAARTAAYMEFVPTARPA